MGRAFFLGVWIVVLSALALGQGGIAQSSTASEKTATTTQKPAPGSSQHVAANGVNEDYDPLFDLPPLPKGRVTLVGGTVAGIDQIRNHLKVRPFGGNSMDISFDERTHIYRDGIETTQLGIHKGDRVYVDTMLDRSRVFAKSVRVVTKSEMADARGQVLSYDPRSGQLSLQDEISLEPINFRVNSTTLVKGSSGNLSASDIRPSSLIAVKFSPVQNKGKVAQEISILAVPGTSFTFFGHITYLDFRTQTIAVENQSDRKVYEISFNPAVVSNRDDLHQGKQVVIQAAFNGRGYTAKDVQVVAASESQNH